jgi:hypothetical protein
MNTKICDSPDAALDMANHEIEQLKAVVKELELSLSRAEALLDRAVGYVAEYASPVGPNAAHEWLKDYDESRKV